MQLLQKKPDTKIALLNVYTLEEVFKYLNDIDKKNFFLSIVSDQDNDYYKFIFDFQLWCLTKDQNKSIEDHIKDLSDNFNQLMDEYIHDFGSPSAKIADINDNPSTSFDTAKVEKKGKNYVMK